MHEDDNTGAQAEQMTAPRLPSRPGLKLRPLSDYTPREVDWLWHGYIPKGVLTVFYGPPGAGKTSLAARIAAQVSRGQRLPDDPRPATNPAKVIFYESEDSIEHVTRQRFAKMDADLDRVYMVDGHDENGKAIPNFRLTELDRLDAELEADPEIAAVVISPLVSYIEVRDLNDNAKVRPALEALGELAARRNVAIIGIGHVNKKIDLGGMQRMQGASAFTEVPRAVYMVAPDKVNTEPGIPHGLFLCAKLSVAAPPAALRFKIDDESSLQFQGQAAAEDGDIDSALTAEPQREPYRIETAKEFLRLFLKDGERPTLHVVAAAKAQDISERLLREARKRLGVRSEQRREPALHWVLFLPKAPVKTPQEPAPPEMIQSTDSQRNDAPALNAALPRASGKHEVGRPAKIEALYDLARLRIPAKDERIRFLCIDDRRPCDWTDDEIDAKIAGLESRAPVPA
jgi:hypothetical protein